MNCKVISHKEKVSSGWLEERFAKLFSKFDVSYQDRELEGDIRREFSLRSKEDGKLQETNIVFTYQPKNRTIIVDRFFPSLNDPLDPVPRNKGLSAVLFYLCIESMAEYSDYEAVYISMEAKQDVFENFYSKVRIYDFQNIGINTKKNSYLRILGDYRPHLIANRNLINMAFDDLY